MALAVPAVGRTHDHIADPGGAATPEAWRFTRLGDVRATTSLRFADDKEPLRAAGFVLGIELPTGSYKVENVDGVRAERSLQPGTGSTDLIVGAFATLPNGDGGLWFAQGTFQSAVKVHDQYRPGNQIRLNGGYRHPLFAHLTCALQVNAVSRRHDSGDNAEPDVTGGQFAFASPGLSYAISPVAEIYAYVQVPVFRNARGAQFNFDWAALAGASYRV